MNFVIKLAFLPLIFKTSFSFVSNNDCKITDFNQVSKVIERCTDIIISNLLVPGGETLNLNLTKGTKVTFEGVTTFEVAYWNGFLVEFSGEGVYVEGAPGSILYARGEEYWDGQGGSGGVKKPKFVHITTTGGSVFKNLYLLNCPFFCLNVHASDLTISGWVIDVVAGNTRGGLNTDGLGVGYGRNILIENSIVLNQDDCIVVNGGSDMVFRNIQCYGTHGLSMSVGNLANEDEDEGVLKNITFTDCLVADGLYGIHLKTKKGHALITDVTYQNIALSGIQEDGIYINQDYGDIGNLSALIEITDLKMINIYGSVQGELTRPVHIVCNENKCSNWTWSDINILGSGSSYCNFIPSGFSC
ncbi:polygalacturonase-like [Diorhabda carinulata]|uniref:polygalacturonase-like n=1 Tax=Diorhabda carinulata TaxID=1163345 RepID=UPI0025A17806|nr:polygalacturonase-like [Diorhabda carinulata]